MAENVKKKSLERAKSWSKKTPLKHVMRFPRLQHKSREVNNC